MNLPANPQQRIVKIRRPAMSPILEVDDDGIPVFETTFDGRRWSDDGDPPSSVTLGDWPAELDE